MTFRFAAEADCTLILDFIRELFFTSMRRERLGILHWRENTYQVM